MNTPQLKISDFASYPGGRYRHVGPYSAEEFRDEYLKPWVTKHGSNFTIDFDGVEGYASSFLEELFGGAIREGVSAGDLTIIISNSCSDDDPDIFERILEYIQDAETVRTSI